MGYPIKDISNMRFGRLVVLECTNEKKNHTYLWLCICDCGGRKIIRGSDLIKGNTRSCGCLLKERMAKNPSNFLHGDYKSREFRIFHKIRSRCNNPNHDAFMHYGGRGIKICDRWLHSYENFLADMGRAPSPKHSIDRIRNEGNYEPGNCRWATQTEQMNNTRRNVLITFNGETKTLTQWCRIYKDSLSYR